MLNIYATNTYKNGSLYVINQLKKTDPRSLDYRHIVIVPDRVSFSAEQEIMGKLGGSFNIRVMTFRRYANTLVPRADYMSKQSAIMTITALAGQNKDKLLCYKKGIDNNGFAESVYETICMFKYARIPPEGIKSEILPPYMRSKLEDIKLLYTLYERYLEDKRYIDSASKMECLLKAINDDKEIPRSYFYIYDFDNFSVQERDIMALLGKRSMGVTVVCCHSEKSYHRYLYQNDILPALTESASQRRVKSFVQKDYTLPQDSFCQQAGNNLYTYRRAEPSIIEQDRLVLCRAMDINDEANNLARYISSEVRKGKRYRDFFVVASDVEKYRYAVKRAFDEYDIPYFVDTSYSLSAHPFVRFVTDYLIMRRNNYKRENVIQFLKNPLFSWGKEIYAFENYCNKYNISYRFDKFELGKDDKAYEEADMVRKELSRLMASTDFLPRDSIRGYINSTKQLILHAELEARTDEFGTRQERLTPEYAKVTAQAAAKFYAVLDALDDILGENVYDFDTFIRILAAGTEGVNISVLPLYEDSVVFTNMAKSKKHGIKKLCIIGAVQGQLPRVKKDTKLITDRNIELLREYGIKVEGKTASENKKERFNVFQLLLEPEESIYISYPRTADIDGAKTEVIPSDYFTSLAALFRLADGSIQIHDEIAKEFFTEKSALSQTVNNTRKKADSINITDKFYLIKSGLYKKHLDYLFPEEEERGIQIGQKLFFPKESISVSRIETFYNCPYKHYLAYGLRLRPMEKAELEAREIGNILHEVLEKFIKRNGADSDSPQLEAATIFDSVISADRYRIYNNDQKSRYAMHLLRNEAVKMCCVVASQLNNTLFRNDAAEWQFGNGIGALAIDTGSNLLRLKGIVDRIDVLGDKCIIIDYKSGSNVSYKEGDIYMGTKLQLLVYSEAVRRELQLKPVGLYYFQLHDSFKDKSKSERIYGYTGRTLNDTDTAAQIDTQLRIQGRSDRLGIRLKKGGDISSNCPVLTEEEMQGECRYALMSIRRAGQLMEQGYIKANPVKDACKYCDYRDICNAQDISQVNERERISAKAKDILEIMEGAGE